MTDYDVEASLLSLLDKLDDRLQPRDSFEVRDYLLHREWGLAFEILCNTIEAEQYAISLEEFHVLEHAGRHMRSNAEYWLKLKPFIKS